MTLNIIEVAGTSRPYLATGIRRIGIGIMDGGIRGLMVTQDFRNEVL
jgi:hypothetical protein